MSLSMAMGIAQGTMSILGGISANRKNTQLANAEYNTNKAFIERDEAVAQSGLQYSAEELNRQTGMALTDLIYSAMGTKGTQRAQQIESGVYGNVAARKEAVMAIREEMAKDRIIQQGESQMVDLQNKMREVKYTSEDKHHQNAQARSNRLSQNKSTFDILAGGVSAGMSGYSSGMDMESMGNTLTNQRNVLALQKAQLNGLLPSSTPIPTF